MIRAILGCRLPPPATCKTSPHGCSDGTSNLTHPSLNSGEMHHVLLLRSLFPRRATPCSQAGGLSNTFLSPLLSPPKSVKLYVLGTALSTSPRLPPGWPGTSAGDLCIPGTHGKPWLLQCSLLGPSSLDSFCHMTLSSNISFTKKSCLMVRSWPLS